MSCEQVVKQLSAVAAFSVGIVTSSVAGVVDSVIKIGATVASIFECVIPDPFGGGYLK